MFERFLQVNLKLSPKKCNQFKHKVAFLGHIALSEGISTNPENVEAAKTCPVPKKMLSKLGKFIRNFSTIVKPLTRLTEIYMSKFSWTSECNDAFTELKSRLVSAPILAYPDIEQDFILDTDASGVGIGAILSQKQDGQKKVITYFSKVLSKSERNYCITRQELLAIVETIKHFHTYLYGVKYTIRADHGSLRWSLNFKNLEGQLCCWAELLATYNYTIDIVLVNYMVRRPCQLGKYCDRIESREGAYLAQTVECNCIYLSPEQDADQNLNLADARSVLSCAASRDMKHGNQGTGSISDRSNKDVDTYIEMIAVPMNWVKVS